MTFVHFLSFVFVHFLLNPLQNAQKYSVYCRTKPRIAQMRIWSIIFFQKLFVLAPLHKG